MKLDQELVIRDFLHLLSKFRVAVLLTSVLTACVSVAVFVFSPSVSIMVSLLFGTLAHATLILHIRNCEFGRPANLSHEVSEVFQRATSIFGVGLLIWGLPACVLLMPASPLLLVVVFLLPWILVVHSQAYLYVVVGELRNPLAALRASLEVIRGNTLKIFGITVVVGLMGTAISLLCHLYVPPVLARVLDVILSFSLSLMSYAVWRGLRLAL